MADEAKFTVVYPPVTGIDEGAKEAQDTLKGLGVERLSAKAMEERFGVSVEKPVWVLDHAKADEATVKFVTESYGLEEHKAHREAAMAQLAALDKEKGAVKESAAVKVGDAGKAEEARASGGSSLMETGVPLYVLKGQVDAFKEEVKEAGVKRFFSFKTNLNYVDQDLPVFAKYQTEEQKAAWAAQPEIQAAQEKGGKVASEKKAVREEAESKASQTTPSAIYLAQTADKKKLAQGMNMIAQMAQRNPLQLDIKLAVAEEDVQKHAVKYAAAQAFAKEKGVDVASLYGKDPTMQHESRLDGIAYAKAALEASGYQRKFDGNVPEKRPTEADKKAAFPNWDGEVRRTVSRSRKPDEAEQAPATPSRSMLAQSTRQNGAR